MQNKQSRWYVASLSRGSCTILIFLELGIYHTPQVTQGQRLSKLYVPVYFISPQYATFMYTCQCHFRECMQCVLQHYSVKKRMVLTAAGKKVQRTHKKKNIALFLVFCEQGGRCFLLWRCQDVCHSGFIHLLCFVLFISLFFGKITRMHLRAHTDECILGLLVSL